MTPRAVAPPTPTTRPTQIAQLPSVPTAAVTAEAAPTATPTNTVIAVPERPVPPRPGAEALAFTLPDLQGKAVSLDDFRGKIVLLNFWATWCGPCRIEIPLMISAYEEYRDQGLEIVAVNMREHPDRVTRFVSDFEMPFPVLLDQSGQIAQSYFVRGIPTSVFLDEEGIIRAVHIGFLTESALRNYVVEMML